MLALVKPAGVPSVPDDTRDESALDAAKDYVKRRHAKPGAVFLGVVHRLDRPVGGVLVFARTSKSAARLAEQFRSGAAKKTYLALGEGRLEVGLRGGPGGGIGSGIGGREGVVEQWLLKDEERNVVAVVEPGTPGAKLARTRWRVQGERAGRTLFEFHPETGRSHQLRLAARTLGAPLLGDLKYGARAPLPDGNIALFAVRLELEHPTTKAALLLEVPRGLWPDWA